MKHLATTSMHNPRWVAVQVKSGREISLSGILEYKGYEVLVPSYRIKKRWSDRWKESILPLFTGYVFCHLSMANRLPVLSTPGVVRIVGTSQGPQTIPADEIDGLKKIMTAKLSVEPHPYLQIGSRARVEKGPLAGTEGIVVEHRNQQRLIISVRLIQQSVAVEIDRSSVHLLN